MALVQEEEFTTSIFCVLTAILALHLGELMKLYIPGIAEAALVLQKELKGWCTDPSYL